MKGIVDDFYVGSLGGVLFLFFSVVYRFALLTPMFPYYWTEDVYILFRRPNN